jgi:hypothetical protein
MNWNETSYHCLYKPIATERDSLWSKIISFICGTDQDEYTASATEIPIEVRWLRTEHREKHDVGDGVDTHIYDEYTIVEVRNEQNDDLYEMSERPTEPWHYLFDKAQEDGDIQPN